MPADRGALNARAASRRLGYQCQTGLPVCCWLGKSIGCIRREFLIPSSKDAVGLLDSLPIVRGRAFALVGTARWQFGAS
jgi:hypothetical protein